MILSLALNLLCWSAPLPPQPSPEGYHPLHAGICEISYQTTPEGTMQITQKLFVDDLTRALNAFDKNKKWSSQQLVGSKAGLKLLHRYYLAHLKLIADGKTLNLPVGEHEIDEKTDTLLSRFVLTKVSAHIQKLDVQNTLLMDTFDDQSQVVYVRRNRKTYTLRLDKDTPRRSLTFF